MADHIAGLGTGDLTMTTIALATPIGALATPIGALATPIGALATTTGALATTTGALATTTGALAGALDLIQLTLRLLIACLVSSKSMVLCSLYKT